MQRILDFTAILVLMALVAVACGETTTPTPSVPTPDQSAAVAVAPTNIPTASPASTTQPTNTPEPTSSPTPSPTAVPTNTLQLEEPTPRPSSTPIPSPTATNTPQALPVIAQPTVRPTTIPMATATATPVPSIDIVPDRTTIFEGTSLQLILRTNISDGTFAWSSSNSRIAEVNSSGFVLGKSVGTILIIATSGSASDSATVTVAHGPVASVQIGRGSGTSLAAILRDAAGHVLIEREVLWSSSDPDVVDVDAQSGELTVKQIGISTITATSEGISDEVGINVSPQPIAALDVAPQGVSLEEGETVQMLASPRSLSGQLLANRDVSWSSGDSDIAEVNATGLVTAKSSGRVNIIATSEGVSSPTVVTVIPPLVNYTLLFSESPDRSNPQSLQGTTTFGDMHIFTSPDDRVASVTFFVNNADGNSAPIKTENAAPYDMLGTLTNGNAQTLDTSQVTPRSYTITAEITQTDGNTVDISATFIVLPIPVDSVEINPDSATIEEGQTVQLSATAFDADGNPLANREIVWDSGNRDVAEVDSSGLMTGVAEGVTTISAEIEGVVASIPVAVTRQQVTFALKVVPDVNDLSTSEPLHGASVFGDIILFVEPKDSISTVSYRIDDFESGNLAADGGIVGDFGSSILISSTGLFDGNFGPHSVIAEVTGVNGETVTLGAVYDAIPIPVASVEIVRQPSSDLFSNGSDIDDVLTFPAPGSISIGSVGTLYAIVKDIEGKIDSDRAVTWSSSNDLIANFAFFFGLDDGSNSFRNFNDQNGSNGFSLGLSSNGNILVGGNDSVGNNGNTFQDSGNDVLPQSAQVRGNLSGTVAITASADGITGTADLTVFFPFQSVSAGLSHACGVTPQGDAYCWGSGRRGRLGNGFEGSQYQETIPVPVSGGHKFSSLSVGQRHTCGSALRVTPTAGAKAALARWATA